MKKVSKLLITGLVIASLSPAAYAACGTASNNCITAKCGNNTITINKDSKEICINGQCITPDSSVLNYINCGSIPNSVLNEILKGAGFNCSTSTDKSDPAATEQPKASEAPEATQAPAKPPVASEAPEKTPEPAAPTAAPTKAPEQAAPTAAPTKAPSVSTNASAMEIEVFNLVNKVRAEYGLNALTWADDLANVARAHSRDMINRNYFSHNDPDGNSPFDRLRKNGISYRTAAENIAYGQRTPQAVMDAWMNSSGHRANILNANVKEIGVGAATASNGTIYWTQMFVAR
ncbi:MAG: hypothetical protein J1G06_03005 [Oscillospiraceae bacterium]|nr:hypothetical protein [Oscillospiraceae bacterium]